MRADVLRRGEAIKDREGARLPQGFSLHCRSDGRWSGECPTGSLESVDGQFVEAWLFFMAEAQGKFA